MSSEPSRSREREQVPLAEAVALVLDAASDGDLIIVDGRSGAGKSTLARELARRWPHAGHAHVIALDDLYPGWDGLAAGAMYAVARVLTPHAAGRPARWQRWDWATDRYDGDCELDAGSGIVLEGSGALTPEAAGFAAVRVWLDAPADVRRERALARDGDGYRPHWERWAAQEEQHIRRNDPQRLATHLLELA
ncbi:AAA family ATPase [Microbacterium sp. cf332]|uniref:AAA family ATPase n=1 Tax=Microbacterium sp. cf332 TaxID=1761804 RepID=UPI00088F1C94|nr:AAA family ATPase [Microbacterium sp. cf332]SDQ10323.1 hypothetical protein SAMN04487847_0359 [Microbacterium sp. cf332]